MGEGAGNPVLLGGSSAAANKCGDILSNFET